MNSPGTTAAVSVEKVQVPPNGVVKAVYTLTIDDAPKTQLIELFNLSLVRSILQPGGMASAGSPGQTGMGAGMGGTQPMAGMGPGMGAMGGQTWGGQQQYGGAQMGGMPGMGAPNVQSVQFPSLNPQSVGSEQGNIGLLMDVYMEMTVELGRTRKLIKDILGMGEGTIIELDKLAGEPVDILVNHKLIARGEVVVIDENFGVRVTEIVSPMDRVEGMT
jgi:flagellar motor switch protein FliN/FliY